MLLSSCVEVKHKSNLINNHNSNLIYIKTKNMSDHEQSFQSLTPALTGYPCEDFPSRTTRNRLLYTEKRTNEAKYLTWNSIRLKSVKKTSMPNAVKSLGYIKCHCWSSPKFVKSPTNSIRYNCEKVSSWLRRPKTILEIKKATFL